MTSNVQLDKASLDLLMPMHVIMCAGGKICSVGPTLSKLYPDDVLPGQSFYDVFELRDDGRAAGRGVIPTNKRLYLSFKKNGSTILKGVATATQYSGEDVLLNLSFGISLVDAVSEHRLTAEDFAHTDLAIEMLYLVEAKSLVLEETKQLNARLQGAKVAAEEQAFTDTLTGLKNRRAMDHVLDRMLHNKVPFALLALDLDYFKDVNDALGHGAGDAVLQAVAQVLADETRAQDLIARVGGDEFVLVLNGMVEKPLLVKMAERIISQIEKPIPFQNRTCRVSGSIGITTTQMYKSVEIDQMIHDADIALYDSKRNGRGCVTVFDADNVIGLID